MLDFKSLETFVWVATLGSFRRAADKLHTTQPAISQRIALLEDDLGVRLLERDKRSVTTTAKGRQLLEYAEQALRLRNELRLAIAGRNAMHGVLRLGVAETIVTTWLPRLIERVHVEHPRLALEIDVDISPNLRERLVAQDIDLAFLLGPVGAASVRNRPLWKLPMSFLASPRLALPPPPVPLAALAQHPLITFTRRTQPYVEIRELFSQRGLPPLRLHASASISTVVRMAADGIGIAVIPAVIAEAEIRAGSLCIVQTDATLSDLTFTASWPVTPDAEMAAEIASIAANIAAQDDSARRLLGPRSAQGAPS